MSLYRELCQIMGEENVLSKEPMSRHTTFRIGGPADFLVAPETSGQVKEVISYLRKWAVPYYVIGNGSNLLVSDKGFPGVIIQISKKMNPISLPSITTLCSAAIFR